MDYYILSPGLFILRIVEFFSQFTLLVAISKNKVPIKKILLGTFIYAVLFEIIKIILPHYLTSVLSGILSISIILLVFKINWKKAIICTLIMGITVAIVDCVVCTCMLKICNLSSFEEITQSNLLTGIAKSFVCIFVLFISQILKKHTASSEFRNVENIKSTAEIITLAFTFVLLIPNLIMILYYYDQKPLPLGIIIANIAAIIAMFFINIFYTRRNIKLVQAEEELINEKIHSKTQEQLVDSLRTFKHDYGNMLQIMHGYIYTKDMDGLSEYFEQLLAESKIITALDILNPELFENSSLFGLVTAKFEYARKNNITMNFEMYAKLNNLDIKSYDFTRIIGILLDNAIEAAIGSKKKIVNFYVSERNNKVTIDISNSFSDTSLKIEDIYKKGTSSKGENRGLGLYKVKDILSKYPKVFHDTKITGDIFLQKLIIDKVKLPVY